MKSKICELVQPNMQFNEDKQKMNSDQLSISTGSTDSPQSIRKVPLYSFSTDSVKRRKIIRMISFLDQQNQYLQNELSFEKRRRAEELSQLLKSLFYFETKLRTDKHKINEKLIEKDNEICRLLRINRYLLKKCKCRLNINNNNENDKENLNDQVLLMCNIKEALQCRNCQKDFYGLDTRETSVQTSASIDCDDTQCSSSDDTVSSFLGARRSLRYTSKRKFNSFKDYVQSKTNSEENNSSITSSQTEPEPEPNSYENVTTLSRTFDKMHGVRNFSPTPYTKDAVPFETSTDDWYASASENEENDQNIRTKPYAHNAVNPVLECVNQILLQQSMEEYVNTEVVPMPKSAQKKDSTSPNVARKRVQFSTQNSMVHIPRLSAYESLPPSEASSTDVLNYESIYSNEYERIDENVSDQVYVDMEAKIQLKKSKLPPALPPKPANLIKVRKIRKTATPPIDDSKSTASTEPDYCSIAEVQITVDVHKPPAPINDEFFGKSSEIEEIFADIPKLPNVAAIIVPKTSPSPEFKQLSPRQIKRKHVPNILAEINKRSPTSPIKPNFPPLNTPKKISVLSTTNPILVPMNDTGSSNLPLQEEFDWYNLDAEYGRIKPDLVVKTNGTNHSAVVEEEDESDENCNLHGVEYNLDEEYSNQPDIIKENGVNGNTFIIEEEIEICNTTKPVHIQRKIYFPGEIL